MWYDGIKRYLGKRESGDETMFDATGIGQYIALLRRNAGLTQDQLAGRMGVSHQAVSNWERGASMPDIALLAPLAGALGTSVDSLLAAGAEKAAERLPREATAASQQPEENDAGQGNRADTEGMDKTLIAERWTENKPRQRGRETGTDAEGEGINWQAVMSLAPFAGPETIRRMLEELLDAGEGERADWEQVRALAPFADHETLDWLVAGLEESADLEKIRSLAPFLSKGTLGRLIESALGQEAADWEQVRALAPFANHETLDRLAAGLEESADLEKIRSLAPFLSKGTLDRLIESALGKEAADLPDQGKQAKTRSESDGWEAPRQGAERPDGVRAAELPEVLDTLPGTTWKWGSPDWDEVRKLAEVLDEEPLARVIEGTLKQGAPDWDGVRKLAEVLDEEPLVRVVEGTLKQGAPDWDEVRKLADVLDEELMGRLIRGITAAETR